MWALDRRPSELRPQAMSPHNRDIEGIRSRVPHSLWAGLKEDNCLVRDRSSSLTHRDRRRLQTSAPHVLTHHEKGRQRGQERGGWSEAHRIGSKFGSKVRASGHTAAASLVEIGPSWYLFVPLALVVGRLAARELEDGLPRTSDCFSARRPNQEGGLQKNQIAAFRSVLACLLPPPLG